MIMILRCFLLFFVLYGTKAKAIIPKRCGELTPVLEATELTEHFSDKNLTDHQKTLVNNCMLPAHNPDK